MTTWQIKEGFYEVVNLALEKFSEFDIDIIIEIGMGNIVGKFS